MKEESCRWIIFVVLVMLFTVVTAEVLDEDMLLYWRRSKSDVTKCEPFTTYFISCNKCVCSADGTEFCTRMACFKSHKFLTGASQKKKPVPVENVNQQDIDDYDDPNA